MASPASCQHCHPPNPHIPPALVKYPVKAAQLLLAWHVPTYVCTRNACLAHLEILWNMRISSDAAAGRGRDRPTTPRRGDDDNNGGGTASNGYREIPSLSEFTPWTACRQCSAHYRAPFQLYHFLPKHPESGDLSPTGVCWGLVLWWGSLPKGLKSCGPQMWLGT